MAKIIDVEERDIDFIFDRARPYSLDGLLDVIAIDERQKLLFKIIKEIWK